MTPANKLILSLVAISTLAACNKSKKEEAQAAPAAEVQVEKVADCSSLNGFWKTETVTNEIEVLVLGTNLEGQTTLTWKGQGQHLKLNGEAQTFSFSKKGDAEQDQEIAGTCVEDGKLVWTTRDLKQIPQVKRIASDSKLGTKATTVSSVRWTLQAGEDADHASWTIEVIEDTTFQDRNGDIPPSQNVMKLVEEVATRVLTDNPVISGPVGLQAE